MRLRGAMKLAWVARDAVGRGLPYRHSFIDGMCAHALSARPARGKRENNRQSELCIRMYFMLGFILCIRTHIRANFYVCAQSETERER